MVKLIVAIAANNVIGKNNDLIWHLPDEMKFFTTTTKGNIVIMGRRNWDSIPVKYRPLPGRKNIVLSRDESFSEEGCEVFSSVESAIDAYNNDERDTFIIGGGQIYKHTIDNDLADELYITKIDHTFDGDAHFPIINESNWNTELILSHEIDDRNPYPFKIWKYTKK